MSRSSRSPPQEGSPTLIDQRIFNAAADKLTVGTRRPSDDEVRARYLGEYATLPDLAQALFSIDNAHIDLDTWPYSHIDWAKAAAEIFGNGGDKSLLNIGGHWFDALAQPPVLAAG